MHYCQDIPKPFLLDICFLSKTQKHENFGHLSEASHFHILLLLEFLQLLSLFLENDSVKLQDGCCILAKLYIEFLEHIFCIVVIKCGKKSRNHKNYHFPKIIIVLLIAIVIYTLQIPKKIFQQHFFLELLPESTHVSMLWHSLL